MKIENRVEALELELKILKNEIQSTLLEIREQILDHYYPELRAAEASRPPLRPDETRGASNGRAKPAAKPSGNGAVPPFSDLFLHDLGEAADELTDDELADEEPLPPVTQRIGRALTRVALDDVPAAADAEATPGAAKAARRPIAALAAWVGEAVAKVGKVRTLQVIETYAASGGALPAETEGRLRQLVALAQDEEPSTPAGAQEMMALLVSLDDILAE